MVQKKDSKRKARQGKARKRKAGQGKDVCNMNPEMVSVAIFKAANGT